jgi:hypothetical protein
MSVLRKLILFATLNIHSGFLDQWKSLDFLSLKNEVNVASRSNKPKNLRKKLIFCCYLEGH